jgi:hypothetical protein
MCALRHYLTPWTRILLENPIEIRRIAQTHTETYPEPDNPVHILTPCFFKIQLNVILYG